MVVIPWSESALAVGSLLSGRLMKVKADAWLGLCGELGRDGSRQLAAVMQKRDVTGMGQRWREAHEVERG